MSRRFHVRGESTVVWELDIQHEGDECDHEDAQQEAKDFVQDMLQLEAFGTVVKAVITGQTDRITSSRELEPFKPESMIEEE